MNDEIVDEATVLKGWEAPDGTRKDGSETHRRHYSRLSVANSLMWNGGWRNEQEATTSDNHAIIDAVSGQLELTPYQKDASHSALDRLPREMLGAYSSSLLALCVCGIVGVRDGRKYHPNNVHPNSSTENEFVSMFETTDATYSSLYSCWKRVKSEL